MKLADIQEQALRQPFREFSIETAGGRWIEVEKASDIFFPPRRPDLVIVFDPSGRLVILEVDSISALEST